MLIVNINTLCAVCILNFGYDIFLNSFRPLRLQNILRIFSARNQHIARLDLVTVLNQAAYAIRNGDLFLGFKLIVCDYNYIALLFLGNANCTVHFSDKCTALRSACLEQLNTRKTLCNILCTRNTAGVEGTHGKLGAWLAYRLSRNYADSLARGNRFAGCKVSAVALLAHAVVAVAGKHRAYLNAFDSGINNFLGALARNHILMRPDNLAGIRVNCVMEQISALKALCKRLQNVVSILNIGDGKTLFRTAVVLTDDNILRNIDQTAGKITRVSCTQSSICKSFTRTARRNKVFKYVKTLTVVGTDRYFDNLTRRIRYKSAHTRKLSYLAHRTARAGVRHHEYRVELVKVALQRIGNILGRLVPYFYNMAAALVVAYKTASVIAAYQINLCLGACKYFLFRRRDYRVDNRNGDSALGGVLKACRLNIIKNYSGFACSVHCNATVDNFTELLFADLVLNNIVIALNNIGVGIFNGIRPFEIKHMSGVGSVNKAQILRNRLIEDYKADRTPNKTVLTLIVGHTHSYRRVQTDNTVVISHYRLVFISEYLVCALFVGLNKSEVVRAEYHILRRNGNRLTVGRLQEVVCRKHKETGLCLCLCRERNMNSHLVAVKVGIVCCTNERVQL